MTRRQHKKVDTITAINIAPGAGLRTAMKAESHVQAGKMAYKAAQASHQ